MRRGIATALVALGLLAAACEGTVEGLQEDADRNIDRVEEEVDSDS
jgi:predicted small secreted protein